MAAADEPAVSSRVAVELLDGTAFLREGVQPAGEAVAAMRASSSSRWQVGMFENTAEFYRAGLTRVSRSSDTGCHIPPDG